MNTVRIFLWLVPFLATRCACETGKWCPPAQEGTAHNISCYNTNGDENIFGVIWQAVTPTGTYSVADCRYFSSQNDFGDGSCTVYDPSSYSATFIDGNSILTIKSVSKTLPFDMETTWNCYWGAGWVLPVCDPLQINEANETTTGEIPMSSSNATASTTENPQESANTTETLLVSAYTTERPFESINITENSGESTNVTENLPQSTYFPSATTNGTDIPSESTMTTDSPLWTAGATENATEFSSVTDGISTNSTKDGNGAMARSGNFLVTITVLLFIKGALS